MFLFSSFGAVCYVGRDMRMGCCFIFPSFSMLMVFFRVCLFVSARAGVGAVELGFVGVVSLFCWAGLNAFGPRVRFLVRVS